MEGIHSHDENRLIGQHYKDWQSRFKLDICAKNIYFNLWVSLTQGNEKLTFIAGFCRNVNVVCTADCNVAEN